MSDNLSPSAPPPLPKKKSPVLAVYIGLIPAVLVLLVLALSKGFNNVPPSALGTVLGTLCFVSVVCCLTASIMLFKRASPMAVLGGVVLLLLNGLIAFGFGCGALISQIK